MESLDNLDKSCKEGSSIEEIKESDLNSKLFLKDHLSFLQWASKDKRIQVIREQSPINDSYFLNDISLYKKGPLEDKIYTRRDDYYNNIERGKAFLEIFLENQKQNETNLMLIKRGFKKFYDLHPLHIYHNLDKKNEIKLEYHSEKIYERIFQNLKSFFEEKNEEEEINLFKIYKENGEHCQISYCKKIDGWIIGSKNVSIAINNLQELEKFEKDRHRWPKLIAETWFSMLSSFSSEQINDLKEVLKGRTILGEHCGHPNHQHIMKYNEIQIIFYALIENEDKEICVDPDIAYNIFQKFKLKTSKLAKFDNINTFEQLNKVLLDLSKKIAAAPMEEEGEGSVIYFTSFNKKTEERKTLAMCKIKSYDYCAFRELREKLKKFILKNYEERTYVSKYCFEIEKLCQYFEANKSVEFYSKVCQNSFQTVKNEKEKYDFKYIYYRFVDFLHEIIEKTSKKVEITNTEIESKSTIKIKKKIQIILITPPCFISNDELKVLCESLDIQSIQYNWREEKPLDKYRNLYQNFITPKLSGNRLPDSTYFLIAGFDKKNLSEIQLNLENMDDKIKNLSPGETSFAISKNIPQKLSLFARNMEIFKNSLVKDFQENLIYLDSEDSKAILLQTIKQIFQKNEETIQKIKKQDSNEECRRNQLVVIIPMGIPGMGKSTAKKIMKSLLEEKGISFYSLSSDEIRKKEFDDYEKNNVILDYNRNEVYKATSSTSSQKFFEGLKSILNMIGNGNNKRNVFFLDKNHTPNIIGTTTNYLKNHCPLSVNMKIIALLPNCDDIYFKHGEHLNYEYPFSLQFFLICLNRCLNRETHETLMGDALHIFKVVLKFFNMFRGFKFKRNTLKVYDIDDHIFLDFHSEKKDFYKTVSSILITNFAKCLESFTPGYDSEVSPILQDFIDEF